MWQEAREVERRIVLRLLSDRPRWYQDVREPEDTRTVDARQGEAERRAIVAEVGRRLWAQP